MIDGSLSQIQSESGDDIADAADGLSRLTGSGFFRRENGGDTFVYSPAPQTGSNGFGKWTAERLTYIRHTDLRNIPSAACTHGADDKNITLPAGNKKIYFGFEFVNGINDNIKGV